MAWQVALENLSLLRRERMYQPAVMTLVGDVCRHFVEQVRGRCHI
eukprot:COSAG01_NODE_7060_length_3371_cov_1.308068_2_plen_45_part_00